MLLVFFLAAVLLLLATYSALVMPRGERVERQAALLGRIRNHDARRWQEDFLAALSATTPLPISD